MFILRKLIEYNLRSNNIRDDDAYFCSLSSKTLVYKGQLTPEQVGLRPEPLVVPAQDQRPHKPYCTPCFACC